MITLELVDLLLHCFQFAQESPLNIPQEFALRGFLRGQEVGLLVLRLPFVIVWAQFKSCTHELLQLTYRCIYL